MTTIDYRISIDKAIELLEVHAVRWVPFAPIVRAVRHYKDNAEARIDELQMANARQANVIMRLTGDVPVGEWETEELHLD